VSACHIGVMQRVLPPSDVCHNSSNKRHFCRAATADLTICLSNFLEQPPVPNRVGTAADTRNEHAVSENQIQRLPRPLREPDPKAVAEEMAVNRDALAALVLRGPDKEKHAALRVASTYDSLFSDDPFGIYRTSPFQTPLWEMLLSYRRVCVPSCWL
jgi:hypothetical protein